MKRIEINDVKHPLHQKGRKLYHQSFPEEERRDEDYFRETLSCERFHNEVVLTDDNEFTGIIYWWNLNGGIKYIEHFATLPSLRCKGIGRKILNEFIKLCDELILLEVEIPADKIQYRRINFYKRLGFYYNDYDYVQPSYAYDKPEVPLRIMSYPRSITADELHSFVENGHRSIHFRN
ncbi:MAG: GNAT family N-acetyltransferase [Prolixibacteraceae bacterium]|nr:GNAT family N-acetyltransferase [Prolixibacteraceae bacterium]